MSAPLIGPAGALANLFVRTLDQSAEPVKLLLTGAPGIGKTALADSIALAICGNAYGIESVNGRKCSIHVVNEWQRVTASSCMFGTGWRCFIVNEVDTCPSDAQDLLLTFLDEMPANTAFIATSNLDVDTLTPRFRTRLQRHEVGAPEAEEIARWLCEVYQLPPMVAQQLAFLCGGCVRAAELDAKAWLNADRVSKAPKKGRAVTASMEFDGVRA